MTIITGVQPSGQLHLGNYVGALQPMQALLEPGLDTRIFIADWHALTSTNDPNVLRQSVIETAATYLALGFADSMIFRQSRVPAHQELAWILSCQLGMGHLERAHAYKDKVQQGLKPNVGLFYYPVLMAADILIHGGTHVPVGADQKQHLEITQQCARAMNSTFELELKIPQAVVVSGAAVPGLDGRKMSKSYDNAIPIMSRPVDIRRACRSIPTDSAALGSPLNMGCTVLALAKLFLTEDEVLDWDDAYRSGSKAGKPWGYGHAKKELGDMIVEKFKSSRARYKDLLDNPTAIESILQEGEEQARNATEKTMAKVRRAVGLA